MASDPNFGHRTLVRKPFVAFNGNVSLRVYRVEVLMDFLWILVSICIGFMLGFVTFGMLQMSRDTGDS